jgi:hypothetical protein
MASTTAVVWNGGTGPLSAVRLASVAHSRIAPTPSAVAVLGDMMSFAGLRCARGLRGRDEPLCAARGASHNVHP